jgi:hypothetical protein
MVLGVALDSLESGRMLQNASKLLKKLEKIRRKKTKKL